VERERMGNGRKGGRRWKKMELRITRVMLETQRERKKKVMDHWRMKLLAFPGLTISSKYYYPGATWRRSNAHDNERI
jgi:hypothetical protein